MRKTNRTLGCRFIRSLLDQGKIERLVGALRAMPTSNAEVAEKIRLAADYNQDYCATRKVHV
jgi:hypothetical protein